MKVSFQTSRCPSRGIDFDFLSGWMTGVANVCAEISNYSPEFMPLHDSEECGVSLLLAGAVYVGLVGVCEYNTIRKRDGLPDRARGEKADLWLLNGTRGVSFEFKQYHSKKYHNRDLGGQMNQAKLAAQTLPTEQDRTFAGVIASVLPSDPISDFDEFCQFTDYAIRLDSAASWTVYLYFDVVR